MNSCRCALLLEIQRHADRFPLGPCSGGACGELRLPNTSQKISGQIIWVYHQLWRKQFLYWVSITLWRFRRLSHIPTGSKAQGGAGLWVCLLLPGAQGGGSESWVWGGRCFSSAYTIPHQTLSCTSGQGYRPQHQSLQRFTLQAAIHGLLRSFLASLLLPVVQLRFLKDNQKGYFLLGEHISPDSPYCLPSDWMGSVTERLTSLSPHPVSLNAKSQDIPEYRFPLFTSADTPCPLGGFLRDPGAPGCPGRQTSPVQKILRVKALKSNSYGFECFLGHSVALWPWACCLTSGSLSCLIYEMRLRPNLGGCEVET